MKAGDIVQWTSQSAGSRTIKEGVIVAVVAAGTKPWVPVGCRPSSTTGFGMVRKHESYLVAVVGTGRRRTVVAYQVKIYWPRVQYLKLL